jgi:hypothetical protein
MADTVYKVVVDLSTQGNLAKGVGDTHGKLGQIESAWGKIGEGAKHFGASLNDAFTGAVEKAGDLAMSLAKAGVAGGIALAAYSVTHLNNELEQTAISMGAIFNAQGFTKGDFGKAMEMAADQVTKMKTDIKTLPGDLGQLSAIMTTIATPAAQGGASPDDIRKLAGKSMLVGGIMNVPPEMVAREMAMLLSGRAGSHNILGSRMGFVGDKAHALHEASPAERFKMVSAELARYDAAAERFGHSWATVVTSLKDNVKYKFLSEATAPLFESVKRTMTGVNGWFDHNAGKLSSWTGHLGDGLAAAWEKGSAELATWGPALAHFASDAFGELRNIWSSVGPLLTSAAHALRDALADGTALAKIESILKLYGAVKLGGMVGPGMMGGGGKLLGMLGQGAAAAGEGGPIGAAIALAGAASAAMALAAAAGVAAAVMDKGSADHERAVLVTKQLGREFEVISDKISISVMPALEHWAVGLAGTLASGLDMLTHRTDYAVYALQSLGYSAKAASDFLHKVPKLNVTDEPAPPVDRMFDVGVNAMGRTAGILSGLAEQAKANVGAKGGKGGTNIQKVEITVSSNQDPSRIARLVFSELSSIARNPTASRAVPNFSAARK